MLKIQLCAVQINERALDAVDNALNRSGPCAPTDIEVRRGSTSNPDRRTLQGILQVAVAQLHLQSGNTRGATILFGEAIGRLKRPGAPDFGLDLESLCNCVSERLRLLQLEQDPEICTVPYLHLRS